MDLLDKYGLFKFKPISQELQFEEKHPIQLKQNQPPLLKYIKKKIDKILPRLQTSIIQKSNTSMFQKGYESLFVIIIQDKILHREKYQYWTQFQFNQQCNLVYLRHYVTLNSIKIKVDGTISKKINVKLCSKLNRNLDSFKINLHPLSGCIQFSNCFTITQKEMSVINKFQKGLNHLLEQIFQSIIKGSRYIDLILLICGYLPLDQVVKNEQISKDFSFLKKANLVIQNLQKQIFKINIFPAKDQKNSSYFGILNNYEIKQKLQYFTDNSQKILQIFTQFRNNIQYYVQAVQSQEQNYNQSYDYQSKSNYSKKRILIPISIIDQPNSIQWQDVCQGGFGIIQAAVVNFYDLTSSSNQYDSKKQILIKKCDKFKNKKKVPRQIQTLKLLQLQKHPNILNFFYTPQKEFQNCLFSQYSPNMSLDLYIQKSKRSVGLDKILFFLIQASKGLNFLHKHQIVHLDVKPGNMIISKNLRLKISDFGEAFILSNKAESHYHAYTIPYCAPQIFQNPPGFYQQTDIYALGVIIFTYVFESKIWMLINKKQFLIDLKNGNLPIICCPQNCQNQILQKFLKILNLLVLKCIDKNHQLRPKMQWILYILEQLRKFISILCE